MQDAAESKEQCVLCSEDGATLEEWSVLPLSDASCSETAAAMVHFLKTSELYLAH